MVIKVKNCKYFNNTIQLNVLLGSHLINISYIVMIILGT